MQKIRLSDFEVKVLDEEERTRGISLIRGIVGDKIDKLKDYPILSKRGMTNGLVFFNTAQTFETEIHNLPLEMNLSITPEYLRLMDKLIEIEPDLFEHYFLRGKIMLHALKKREDFVIMNRERLKDNTDLQKFKKEIIDSYPLIRQDFKKSLNLLDRINESNGNALDFYKTKIGLDLGISYKREVFFKIRSSPNHKDLFNLDLIDDALIPAKAAVDIYRRLLNENTFLDTKEAAIVLYNLANCMKLFLSKDKEDYKEGLKYCIEARKILGPLPEIEEAIGYYKGVLQEKR